MAVTYTSHNYITFCLFYYIKGQANAITPRPEKQMSVWHLVKLVNCFKVSRMPHKNKKCHSFKRFHFGSYFQKAQWFEVYCFKFKIACYDVADMVARCWECIFENQFYYIKNQHLSLKLLNLISNLLPDIWWWERILPSSAQA